ncbi:hypothetical protein P153DRAFT_399115 [Dothidotthia symphoricarpi CBS 119687]|uniref:Uncharacterized protein n=1 Tax=Dothidotthia symphoricarpi CBS 119687 TaxID=1392245 RepID=A0A6A6A379_9PLEO|nr:uncharacterized protein P153DRAFT_399115 [Dothidotthia symphoricarpi CBS 119687]KAF2126329.1 hypothetical protein P153DRAFT_399115 [Dothidotthia symphoricarpi CBS 119687]
MPNKNPRLSRDELVAIISDFYKFLTTFYIPTSALKYSPPDGWPNTTFETTAGFGKKPFVIDLIKHLSYIDGAQAHQMVTNIHHKSDVVDYSVCSPTQFANGSLLCGEMGLESELEDRLERGEEEGENDEDEVEDEDGEEKDGDENDHGDDDHWSNDDPDEIILENMVVLAEGYESGGRSLVLDVFKGYIHEDEIRCNLLGGVAVEDFFRDLRDKYERLEMVPIHGAMFENVAEIYDDEMSVDGYMGNRRKQSNTRGFIGSMGGLVKLTGRKWRWRLSRRVGGGGRRNTTLKRSRLSWSVALVVVE